MGQRHYPWEKGQPNLLVFGLHGDSAPSRLRLDLSLHISILFIRYPDPLLPWVGRESTGALRPVEVHLELGIQLGFPELCPQSCALCSCPSVRMQEYPEKILPDSELGGSLDMVSEIP